MSDLIDRQAAIDDLNWKYPSQIWDTADIEVCINALPSAQPELIRCKDCAYWDSESRECSSPNYPKEDVTPAGFYCGWAERRQDG